MLEELNCAAMEAFIRETNPAAVQAEQYLNALRSLPSRARLSEKVDLFERCAYLDALLVIRANQEETIAYLDCEPGLAAAGKMVNLFWKDAIDWNETLRIGNRYYNRLVKSLEQPSLSQRRENATALRQELRSLAESAIGIRGKDDAANGRAATESKSKLLAAIIAENLMADIDKHLLFEARAQQRFTNLEIALALAAFHSDHASYPESLSELAPEYFSSAPQDCYSGNPPIYRRHDGGYLLYSVGENGKDDGGREVGDVPAGDDLSIRMNRSSSQ